MPDAEQLAPNNIRYLSRSTLESLEVTPEEVVECIERLMRARRQSRAWSAPKAAIHPPDGRLIMATLAAAADPPYVAVKSLVLNPRNAERGLAGINSLVTLLDSDTGVPVAVMDGNWVTAVRTAGMSAVAARRLARPDSSVVAFIGCGVQACSHLRALAALFPLKAIRAFGRGSANRDALCRIAEAMGLAAVASPTARDAVRDADLVVSTVTVSPQLVPFLDARWLKPGACAVVVDLAASWLPEGMAAFDRIVIDDMEQESVMPAPMVAPELVAGDLTGLVHGEVAGRRSNEERTAFVSRGIGLGDLALASLAYQRATQGSRGILLEV
jgi:ornithine cyclodeaminase/alanine dehydrogenase-like protein (mu-crystallin family)